MWNRSERLVACTQPSYWFELEEDYIEEEEETMMWNVNKLDPSKVITVSVLYEPLSMVKPHIYKKVLHSAYAIVDKLRRTFPLNQVKLLQLDESMATAGSPFWQEYKQSDFIFNVNFADLRIPTDEVFANTANTILFAGPLLRIDALVEQGFVKNFDIIHYQRALAFVVNDTLGCQELEDEIFNKMLRVLGFAAN